MFSAPLINVWTSFFKIQLSSTSGCHAAPMIIYNIYLLLVYTVQYVVFPPIIFFTRPLYLSVVISWHVKPLKPFTGTSLWETFASWAASKSRFLHALYLLNFAREQIKILIISAALGIDCLDAHKYLQVVS